MKDMYSIKKDLVSLSKEQLFNLSECLENYKKIVNKSNFDNIFVRYIALRGYKSLTDFYNKVNITKDSSIASAIHGETNILDSYLVLKELLHIDNEEFLEFLESRSKSLYAGEVDE